MNLLKPLFINGFIGWLVVISGYSLYGLASGNKPWLSWLGLALTALAPLAFFIRDFIAPKAHSARHPVGFSVMGGLGLAVTMAISHRYGPVAGNVHVWAGVTLALWVVYLRFVRK